MQIKAKNELHLFASVVDVVDDDLINTETGFLSGLVSEQRFSESICNFPFSIASITLVSET